MARTGCPTIDSGTNGAGGAGIRKEIVESSSGALAAIGLVYLRRSEYGLALDELEAANLVARHIKTKPPIVQEFRAVDARPATPSMIV